jgi:ATP-dependent DNA helicase PIF1
MRLLQDQDSEAYAQTLLDVGQGATGSHFTVPDEMRMPNLDTLIESIYGDISQTGLPPPPEYFLNRSILTAQNEDVDELNHIIIDKHPGSEEIFYSTDTVVQEAGADEDLTHVYTLEFLRSLSLSGLPKGELCLKTGAPILLMQNLAP